MTHDIIDAAITITDVELCAMWTPLSIVCGSGWFLDESVKSKMVSFAPLMKKQSFWMISRFVRCLILNELGEDLSVDTRQDIFLYSSKIGILPGFPTPNGGWPTCTAEWMTVAPYFSNAMDTNEMKAFMRRYGYKTKGMVAEELRIAKELEEKRVAEILKKEAEEKERKRLEELERQVEIVAPDSVVAESEINGNTGNGDNDIMLGGAGVLGESTANVGMSGEEVPDLTMPSVAVEGAQKGMESWVTKVEAEMGEQEREIKIEEAGDSPMEDSETSTCDSDDSSRGDDSEDDDFIQGGRRDFATSMRVLASTKMTEEEFLQGQADDEVVKARLDQIRETLKLAGVRRWMDTNLHLLLLSGPVGISRWTLGLLKTVQKELKMATVKIKDLNANVIQTMVDIQKHREEQLKADEVWEQAQKDLRGNMDMASEMQKVDLRGHGMVGTVGGLFGSWQSGSSSKRRSIYGEDRKKKKSKLKNPFERETSGRSDTL